MEGGCGGVEVRNKVEKEKGKKRKRKKVKRGFLVVLKHSVTHSHFHCSSIKSFPSFIPQFPQNTPLSLIVDEHTNTHLPHSYLSYKSTTIHVLTRIQITPQLLILPFKTTHSISLPLPPKTIISLVNPQNQSLLPFSLIHII